MSSEQSCCCIVDSWLPGFEREVGSGAYLPLWIDGLRQFDGRRVLLVSQDPFEDGSTSVFYMFLDLLDVIEFESCVLTEAQNA